MNYNYELKVFPTIEDVCSTAANIFSDLLNTNGKNIFIVPGGSTPQIFYNFLAQSINDWKDTTLLLSDERLVHEDFFESNFGMIKRNLLDLIQNGDSPKLISVLNKFLPEQSSQILKSLNILIRPLHPIKAAFLGVGADGHTASIFPGIEEDGYNEQPFFLVNKKNEEFQRISISSTILSEIPLLIFLVAGKGKKKVLSQIINVSSDVSLLPIHHVMKKAKDKVLILCDRNAAP
jgi:6-phosphogluconolactonase